MGILKSRTSRKFLERGLAVELISKKSESRSFGSG
jgi:hypothetical protein